MANQTHTVSPIARLSMEQADQIRKRYRRGDTQMELAWFFEVSQTTISKIVNNQIYRGKKAA